MGNVQNFVDALGTTQPEESLTEAAAGRGSSRGASLCVAVGHLWKTVKADCQCFEELGIMSSPAQGLATG